MEQKSTAKSTHEYEEEAEVNEKTARDLAATAEKMQQLDSDIDDVLNEIDDVLESNSEQFVRDFVQKGGQ